MISWLGASAGGQIISTTVVQWALYEGLHSKRSIVNYGRVVLKLRVGFILDATVARRIEKGGYMACC
jgi:hypothetical protein